MKKVVRAVLVFLGLLFIGAALFLLAVNYRLIPGITVSLPGWANETILLATGAGFLLLALVALSIGLRSSKKIGNAVIKGSEYGEVLISITALENMVLRVVQQTQGIKDVSRQVNYTTDGLVVRIHIRVMPDVPLPDLISGLQAKTKEYLEEITGVVVHEVKVNIDNIIVDQASVKK